MRLEEFPLGHTWVSEPREVTAEDLELFTRLSGDDHPMHRPAAEGQDRPDGEPFQEPVLHGTFGLALFTGFVHQLGLAHDALALLDTLWHYTAPIRVGDTLTCSITVTRARTTSTTGRGVIHRSVELSNQRGDLVQRGTSALLVRHGNDAALPLHADPGSPSWGQAIADRLESMEEFTTAVADYDGTVGIAVGDTELHLRIYRGRVLEAVRRALRGSDFTVRIPEDIWWELMTAKDNELMKQAMKGHLSTSGNGAEYLRMTRVVVLLVAAARDLYREETAR